MSSMAFSVSGEDVSTRDAPVFFYFAYGQRICSAIPLPELDPAPVGPPDVTFSMGRIERAAHGYVDGVHFEFGTRAHYLAWQSVGRFLVMDGSHVLIEPNPGVEASLIAFPLLGPVMALLLYQRRMLVLHASAVNVGGRAAVFLGDKGAGKSTTAGLMLQAGHRFVSDDVVAFDFPGDGSRPSIPIAFPQIKLADDAASALAIPDAHMRPDVHPAIPKRQHRLARIDRKPVFPGGIYVLERAERAEIVPFAATEALSALMRFSFATRFGPAVFADGGRAAYFRQNAKLADTIGVHRLCVPQGLERAVEVVDLIEKHIAQNAGREA